MGGNASVICLEGPSAVGKSAVARHLEQQFGAYVVPEVNVLFKDIPAPGGTQWIFDGQADG